MRLVFVLLPCLLSTGCDALIGLDDPPPLRETDGAVADGTVAETAGESDTSSDDTSIDDAATDADATEVSGEPGPDGVGNLLLYRLSDGAALLTRIDPTGAASTPKTLSFPAGFSAIAGAGDLVLGVDDVKFTATLVRLDRNTGSVTELKTRSFSYPFQFVLPLPENRFVLQSTDYEHLNHTVYVHWDDSASTLDVVNSRQWAAWSTGATTWDDHLLFYYRGPALETITTWATYSVAKDTVTFTDYFGDQVPIGPFWERIVAFGATGVFALRGPSPHGRVIPVVPVGFPDGVDGGIGPDASSASAPKNVVDLPAPIALLGGTKVEQLIIHQGDALVTGTLVPKGNDRAFVPSHRYDTGPFAKSWTSMAVLAD